MKNTIRTILWCSALCGSIATLMASPPVIGVARSWGAFLINDASVPGSATLLDGTSLKTVDASSDLNLTGGERVTISSNSSATIHGDRLQLDSGTAEFTGTAAYRVEARNLRIGASDSAARVRVAVDRQNHVLVASLGGAAEIRNAQGMLVARVLPGTALTLSAADVSTVELTGTIQEHNGEFYMVDEITKVKVELRGSNLKSLVGKHVHIVGSEAGKAVATDVLHTVLVATATQVGAAAAGAGAASAGAGVAAAAAGVAGAAAVPVAAIVGGVAVVGGTVGGLAATGVIGSSPSVSR
jgi:hypothetical protein